MVKEMGCGLSFSFIHECRLDSLALEDSFPELLSFFLRFFPTIEGGNRKTVNGIFQFYLIG